MRIELRGNSEPRGLIDCGGIERAAKCPECSCVFGRESAGGRYVSFSLAAVSVFAPAGSVFVMSPTGS